MSVLPQGSTVFAYTIERALGQGGFGITYLAANRVTGRRVALKEMFMAGMAQRRPDGHVEWEEEYNDTIQWALELFERTTGDLAQLDHPNIVKVLDYLPANNTGYMLMELIAGETLTKWLRAREGQKLDPASFAPVMAPVLDAVAYCHQRGLIHRDIKPDNVMIEQGGRPVLIDFGLVKRIADNSSAQQAMTRMSAAVFSDYYGSPEQRRQGEAVGAGTDIYALGAILYRAFAGEPPADASHRVASLGLGGRDTYKSLAVARPDLPPQVIEIVDRCLKLRLEERPASTAEIADALGWPKGDAATQVFAGRGARSSLPDPKALAAQTVAAPPGIGRPGHSGGEPPRNPSWPPGAVPQPTGGTPPGFPPVPSFPQGASGGALPGASGAGFPQPGGPPQGYPPQGPGYPPAPGAPQGFPPQGFQPQGFPPQAFPPPGYPAGAGGPPPGFPQPPGFQPPPGFPQPPQGPPYGAVPAGLLGPGAGAGGFGAPPGDGLTRKPKSSSGLAIGGAIAVALVAAVVGFVLFSGGPNTSNTVTVTNPPSTISPPATTPPAGGSSTALRPPAGGTTGTPPTATPPAGGGTTPPAAVGTPPRPPTGTPPAAGGTNPPRPIDPFGAPAPPLGTTPPAGGGAVAGGTPPAGRPIDPFGGASPPAAGTAPPAAGSTPAPASSGPPQACDQQPTVAWCDASNNPTR